MLKSPKKSSFKPTSSLNPFFCKSELLLKSRKIDPILRDLNSFAPDFLKGRPFKASRQIFSMNSKAPNQKTPKQSLDPNSINLKEIDQISWSDNLTNNNDEIKDLSGFLFDPHEDANLRPQILSNPLEYYQNFKMKNLDKIEALKPNQYIMAPGVDIPANQSFHSEENVEEAKFVNFDKENMEVPEERQIPIDGNIENMIEIEILLHDFDSLNERTFEAYERVLVNVEEYDNLIMKKKQNHASFAFISLIFLRKMLRKFNEACICLENFLKAEKLLPQIPQVFALNFNKQIKTLKNWDFKNLDLDLLLNPEGSFSSNIMVFATNLQYLQKILNHAKILYSSMSSSKNFEVPFNELQQKVFKEALIKEEKPKKGSLKNVMGNMSQRNPIINNSQKISEKPNNPLKKKGLKEIINPLELFKAFMEMKNLLINMLNINYKQNLLEANLKEKLQGKDEVLPERMERDINYMKSEEIVNFANKTWTLFSENKAFFLKLETQYIHLLKQMIDRCENHYFRYFSIYQKLSFSMESLRKLCQLNLEEIKLLELETKEILEKSIIKLEFPLGLKWKTNERVFVSILERREKLLNKVVKLKKETKIMRKSLKNEYFYLLYLQKCDETLSKVAQIHHNLKSFSEILDLLKESIPLEALYRKFSENTMDFENQEVEILKSKKSQHIQLYQTIQPYKNRVSLIKQRFPTFFEIEKELNRELEFIELNLQKINEVIEGKSPEILEKVDLEIEVSEKLIEKLHKSLNSELSLRDYAKTINKNQQLDFELTSKSGSLRRWMGIHGLTSEKKQKIQRFNEEMMGFLAKISNGKVIVRVIQQIKPERVKKLLERLQLKDVFEDIQKEEQFEDWFRELDHEIEILRKTNDELSEQMLKKNGFRDILLNYREVYKIILEDYNENVKKLKDETLMKNQDYAGKVKKTRGEIVNLLENIDIKEELAMLFINPIQLMEIIDKYFKETMGLFGNQTNTLNKLSHKKQVYKYKEIIEKLKANFLQKGIKAHIEEKLKEMTVQMKETKAYLKDFKAEILQQKLNKDDKNAYSLMEVKELVFIMNVCIKGCLFMISIGGISELFLRKLNEIKKAFQQEEEVAITLSQRIKEAATDILLIRKRIKSTKAYLGTEFEDFYNQTNELIELSTQHLSILYELLGDLSKFDGVFNENGFEINAKSEEFYQGMLLFIKYVTNFPNKKKTLIEARQKIIEKVNNIELQELSKPLESINVTFFKVMEAYIQVFDLEYLKYLEPKLSLITEANILRLSKEISHFIETFHIRAKDDDKDSASILIWLKQDIPKITLKIKIIMEILDSDLSYKGFCSSINRKANEQANKMLDVENLNDCKTIMEKEKMRNWETILLTISNVVTGYFTDKTADNLKNLSQYKEKLFGLKKMNHSANKEMNLINGVEEILKYDFKMNEKL